MSNTILYNLTDGGNTTGYRKLFDKVLLAQVMSKLIAAPGKVIQMRI